ncbi:MAG: hypothetical protein GY718_09590 [Lentisphaerae bacterium]|nr:hypothetical protein [Lentisphaerota bacterium]
MAADGMIATGGVSGTDSVPALLTPGEAVLPKGLTDMLRQSAAGKSRGFNIVTANSPGGGHSGPTGGGESSTVVNNTFNVSGLDTGGIEESLKRLLEDNPDAVGAGFRQAARVGAI